MTVVAHISDLHFGTEDPYVAAALLGELDGSEGPVPALVAVSGDLTQRARPEQFRACRHFLAALPGPTLVVPGNHDVPLYDLASRLFDPYGRYREHLGRELEPVHVDDALAVVGVNTAHGRTIKGGRITLEQARAAAGRLIGQGDRTRILVAHHPFVIPAGADPADRVDGAAEALPILEDAGLEIILTGHLHIGFLGDTAGFRSADRAVVAVHAGTCFSTRTRGEPNSYNRLAIDGHELTISHRVWDGARFVEGGARSYRRVGGRWRHADAISSAARSA